MNLFFHKLFFQHIWDPIQTRDILEDGKRINGMNVYQACSVCGATRVKRLQTGEYL
jgi:hypothetical protein